MYEEALKFATQKHSKQIRKYTGEPYINHCIEIVQILKDFGYVDETMLTAAILHDTVEDTDTTFQEIKKNFGSEVLTLVFFLTDIVLHPQGNRETRNELNRLHIIGTSDIRSLIIKCADLISNQNSIALHDPNFAVRYLREKRELLTLMDEKFPFIGIQPIFIQACELSQKEISK